MRSFGLFLALLFAATPLISATCYWQNSTLAPDSPYSIAPDDTACFPSQDNSPCCGTGWSCLSDGVCYIEEEGQGFYYRGTCTDRTWDSQQCPGWCFAENSNTSIPLLKCSEADGADWYCCPGDENCSCDSGKDALKLGAAQPSTVTVVGSTSWPGFVSTTTPFSTSAFAPAGTSTTNAESAAGTAASTTRSSSAGPGSAAAASASASASNSNGAVVSEPSAPTANTGVIAGAAVGGAAVLALIGGLGWFLGRRHYRRKEARARQQTMAAKRPYAPEMGTGPEHHHGGGAWAADQRKRDHGYENNELPSTGSHARSEAPGEEMRRHELEGAYGERGQKRGRGPAAEMLA